MTDIGPGDVVVCVDASGLPPVVTQLNEGARYIVAWIGEGEGYSSDLTVLLDGIVDRDEAGNFWGYLACRFRPLNDGDSEQFREMIRDLPVREKEPVA